MAAKTKIDWCDSSWNPVTGCLHGCEYCYAERMTRRFGCKHLTGPNHLYILNKPARRKNGSIKPYPYGFTPTLYRYKLDLPQYFKTPRSIFVCSMADLFGEWVPDEWILEVLKACQKAPQHRYIFLTKNPLRYDELFERYDLFRELWTKQHFGATATNNEQLKTAANSIATWLSIEPILEPVYTDYLLEHWSCVVVGAETGRRKCKVIPKKEWIMDIVEACSFWNTPVFMKESLRGLMGDDFVQGLPWEVSR